MLSQWKSLRIATDRWIKLTFVNCELLINISTPDRFLTYSPKTETINKVCSVSHFDSNFFMNKLMNKIYIFFGSHTHNPNCLIYNNCIGDLRQCIKNGKYYG